MKKELEEKLVKAYPNLYQDYGGSKYETCMAWGFECNDGWYEIIDNLSAKLEVLGAVAEQVKEKFGGLRFYVLCTRPDTREQIYDLIHDAEVKSYKTCEICGKEGKPIGKAWITTLCKNCAEERRLPYE